MGKCSKNLPEFISWFINSKNGSYIKVHMWSNNQQSDSDRMACYLVTNWLTIERRMILYDCVFIDEYYLSHMDYFTTHAFIY